jgi:hypothetical protein
MRRGDARRRHFEHPRHEPFIGHQAVGRACTRALPQDVPSETARAGPREHDHAIRHGVTD